VRIARQWTQSGVGEPMQQFGDPTGACRAWECGALAYTTIEKTGGRPGLVGRAARGAAVCVAVALLSGCGGWPYIGAVSSTVSPLYAPQYSPPVQQGYIPYPQPLWPSPPPPPIAEPAPPPPARPDMGDDVAAPQSPAGVVPQGDPASLLPVPPVAQLRTLVPADPRTKTPTTELPPVGPSPPPPPPAGDDDACVGAWRICHFL
jgi:hypothetical protein